ncbi:MAG: YtxH domain-containing protein [Abitibacteriaceae bacterium]|nr:YtxH domain-containing protein [Abditibacteriaceae bacterium]
MKKAIAFMGIGAGLMYLFDPTHGEERRGQLKEKFAGMMPQTKDALSAKTEAVAAKVDELTSQVDTVAAQKVESLGGDTLTPTEDSASENSESQSSE